MNNIFLDPNFFDPTTLLGLGFAMHVESLIEYLKTNWFLPGQLAPYVATVISLVSQIALCWFFHVPYTAALVGTMAQTAATCWYHELTTTK